MTSISLFLENSIVSKTNKILFTVNSKDLDVAKAFDSVDHVKLIQTFARIGVPRRLLVAVASMYQSNNIKFRGNKMHVARGVVQRGTNVPDNLQLGVRQYLTAL